MYERLQKLFVILIAFTISFGALAMIQRGANPWIVIAVMFAVGVCLRLFKNYRSGE